MDEKCEVVNGECRLLPNETEKSKFGGVNHPCQFRGVISGSIEFSGFYCAFLQVYENLLSVY